MVRAWGSHHRSGAIFLFYPLDLAADDFCRLVPTDLLVSRFPSILAVPFSSGTEVNPFEGAQQSRRRIEHRTPGKRVRRESGFPRWGKLPTPCINDPGWSVQVVKLHRRNTYDPAILHVHKNRATRCPIGQLLNVSHNLSSRKNKEKSRAYTRV